MSIIFSPNYSVGTVLCTLQCPGSGMAWWVMVGAKLRPPLIVLALDFPYTLVSMCGTSALPFSSPSPPGLAGWQLGVGVGAGSVPLDVSIARLPVSGLACFWSLSSSCWYKVGGKYHNSVQISVDVRSLICCCLPPTLLVLHPCCGFYPGCLVHPALQPRGSERGLSVQGNEALQHGRRSLAKHPPKESSCLCCSCYSCVLKRALRLWYFFSLESLWLTHEWVRCLPAFFFSFYILCKRVCLANICIILKSRSKGCSGFNGVVVIG